MAPRSSGRRRHPLKLQRPTPGVAPIPDGDGDYEQDFETFAEVFGSVEAATAARLEKLTNASTLGSATDIVVIPFLSGIQLQQRVIYNSRRLDVIGYCDPEERHIELVLVCQEIKQ